MSLESMTVSSLAEDVPWAPSAPSRLGRSAQLGITFGPNRVLPGADEPASGEERRSDEGAQ